jgi:hypothetical protein
MGAGIVSGGSSLENSRTPALVEAARKLLVRLTCDVGVLCCIIGV